MTDIRRPLTKRMRLAVVLSIMWIVVGTIGFQEWAYVSIRQSWSDEYDTCQILFQSGDRIALEPNPEMHKCVKAANDREGKYYWPVWGRALLASVIVLCAAWLVTLLTRRVRRWIGQGRDPEGDGA